MSQKVGEFDYACRRVAADVVYLWPKRPVVVNSPPGFYDPFWGPGFGPYWGGYPYGGFYPRRVIVVRPPPPPPKK